MPTHYAACANENEALLAPAIERANRVGPHQFVARGYSDQDVIAVASGHDFGFLLPRSEMSLHRIADNLERKQGDEKREPLQSIVAVGYTPLVFLLNPACASRMKVLQRGLGWNDIASGSCSIRHATARQLDGEIVGLAQHLALPSADDRLRVQQQVEEYGPDDREVLQRAAADGWRTDLVIAQERSILEFARQHPEREGVVVYPRDGTLALPTSAALVTGWYGEDSEGAFAQMATALQATSREVLAATGLHKTTEDLQLPTNFPATGRLQWAPHAGVKTTVLPARPAVHSIRHLALEGQRSLDVCLLFDSSESMRGGGKFDAAVDGMEAFLALLSPRSRIALIRIQSQSTTILPLTARGNFHYDRAALTPEGRTALIDAAGAALDMLARDGYSSNIRAIVGFTDGQENASWRLLADVEAAFRQHPNIRFYGIGYGADADISKLQRLAAASNGLAVQGGTSQIKALYERLSTYF